MRFTFMRVAAMTAVVLILAAYGMKEAAAVWPYGGYTDDNRLRFIKWPTKTIIDKGGIPITFQSGEWGWTNAEQEILRESFAVWENVPTSFAGFQFTQNIPDPWPPGEINGFNMVFIQLPGEPQVGGVEIPGGVAGVALITYAIEDTTFQVVPDGTVFPVSGGQIIECDIVIEGPSHRPEEPGQEPLLDLKSTMVHEIGHLLGLGHSPLENFVGEEERGDLTFPVEEAVLGWRDATGDLTQIGVVPTMYPFVFLTEEPDGTIRDGARDLAPDDIGSVSFLYPRGQEQINRTFFEIRHEGRTRGREGLPSRPILGGHVVAWVDHDNDPETNRIPLTSTITGLWERQNHLRGRFRLKGLLQELETPDGELFTPTYTLTMEPINPLTAMHGQDPPDFDSLHEVLDGVQTWDVDYDQLFFAEVFREDGNLFDIENRDAGTPLKWDRDRQRVISATTERSIDEILRFDDPMFGSPVDNCPLNLAVGALTTNRLPSGLRSLRDNVLLQNAAGIALVDFYYSTTPATVAFLNNHGFVLNAAQGTALAVETLLHHRWALLFSGAAVFFMGAMFIVNGVRRRRLAYLATAGVLILAGLTLVAAPASANILHLNTPEVIQKSDDIVTGKVVSVESYWTEGTPNSRGRILTDVTVEISDTMKGRVNKDSQIHFTVPGGRVGAIAQHVTHMPRWREGEEVMLFLEDSQQGNGHLVVGGPRGKYGVEVDPESGEKYVTGDTAHAKLGLRDVADSVFEKKGELDEPETERDLRISLEDMKEYVREVVAEQAMKEQRAR